MFRQHCGQTSTHVQVLAIVVQLRSQAFPPRAKTLGTRLIVVLSFALAAVSDNNKP